MRHMTVLGENCRGGRGKKEEDGGARSSLHLEGPQDRVSQPCVPQQTPFQVMDYPDRSPRPPSLEAICRGVVMANGAGGSEFKP